MSTHPPRRRAPGLDDRVKVPGHRLLFTVRAVSDDLVVVVGSQAGSLRVIHSHEVTVVKPAKGGDCGDGSPSG